MTEVAGFSVKHLGSADKHALKLKAAETWGVLRYMQTLLREHGGALGPERDTWARVVSSLIDHVQVMRENGRTLGATALQNLVDTFHFCIGALRALPFAFPWTPKFHLWGHLLQQAWRLGNPRFGSTFLDESFNGLLKRAARGCHGGHTFERRLFWKVNQIMRKFWSSRRSKKARWW